MSDRATPNRAGAAPSVVLDVAGVAAYLAFSERTVRDMLAKGELPGVLLRGRWRVLESALVAFLERGQTQQAAAHEHAVRVLRGLREGRRAIVVPPRRKAP